MSDFIAYSYSVFELFVAFVIFLIACSVVGITIGHVVGFVGDICRFFSDWE